MDAFEQWMNMSWEKSPKERKDLVLKKRDSCICPACPSYNNCATHHNELLYALPVKACSVSLKDKGYLQTMRG